jgi:hypothetical protein
MTIWITQKKRKRPFTFSSVSSSKKTNKRTLVGMAVVAFWSLLALPMLYSSFIFMPSSSMIFLGSIPRIGTTSHPTTTTNSHNNDNKNKNLPTTMTTITNTTTTSKMLLLPKGHLQQDQQEQDQSLDHGLATPHSTPNAMLVENMFQASRPAWLWHLPRQ